MDVPDLGVPDLADPAVARHYDELPLWSAPFGQLVLDRVPLRAGQRMLDVGAGTGFLSVELAQRCGPASHVVAVDPWTAAAEVLRAKCAHLGLTNVEVRVAGAAALDLPGASIDVVVANLGINNFADPDAVLAQCRRVLRPGGTLVMSSNLVGHMREFYDVYRETLLALGRDDLVPALEAEIDHRTTVDATRARLRDAGLTVEHVDTAAFTMRYADGSALLRHHFIRLGFLAGWRALVPPADVATVFAELETRLNRRAAERDGLVLTVPAACVTATA